MLQAEFPEKLDFLFAPARYKIMYGGRGGAKSWGVARALLILGAKTPLRVLCAREIQKSVKDSVHKLLSDQIARLGLGAVYRVLAEEIRGLNGTEFVFAGLRHNVDSIKSKEGIDIVWIEEAQAVSKASWDKLLPTIRKAGSEIWVTFNPELDSDETYRRFVVHPPDGAVVVKINYADNPWFPAELEAERRTLLARDPDGYLTVWEGHCRHTLDGAVYANEIREATLAGRITRVPWDAAHPVHTFWDLGRADMTSIWFAQGIGFEWRVIDFHQHRGVPIGHYTKLLKEKPYTYGDTWLPHDAQAEQLGATRTVEQQVRDAGFDVSIVPRTGLENGINAARTAFTKCWFDAEKCADGLNALRRYRYDVDEDTGTRCGASCRSTSAAPASRPSGPTRRPRAGWPTGWARAPGSRTTMSASPNIGARTVSLPILRAPCYSGGRTASPDVGLCAAPRTGASRPVRLR